MTAQVPFTARTTAANLVAAFNAPNGLADGRYVVQNRGPRTVEYTNAPDATTAGTVSWKCARINEFFQFEVGDSIDPVWVRSESGTAVLSISDG